MPKRWLEARDRHTGAGNIRDHSGVTCPVSYLIDVRQNVWEQPQLGGPTGIGRGTYELSGVFTLQACAAVPDLLTTLALILSDGSELEIIVTRIGDRRAPMPFKVAKAGRFFDRYEGPTVEFRDF